VEQMVEMERTTPNWFSSSHHRRLVRCGIERKSRPRALIQQQPNGENRASRGVTIPMVITIPEGGESDVGTATIEDGRTSITPPANLEQDTVDDTGVEAEMGNLQEVGSSEREPQADSGIFHTGDETMASMTTTTTSVPPQPSERTVLPSRVEAPSGEEGEVVENEVEQSKQRAPFASAGDALADSGQKIRDLNEYGDSGMVTDSDVPLIQAT